jgi:hypothetical protein
MEGDNGNCKICCRSIGFEWKVFGKIPYLNLEFSYHLDLFVNQNSKTDRG